MIRTYVNTFLTGLAFFFIYYSNSVDYMDCVKWTGFDAAAIAHASITAFFTVLVEGDDLNDPIADQSRSILDGHIVLSRELSEFGIYPPINILSSASRIMNDIIDKKHKENAMKFRKTYSLLKENEILIRIGSYQRGNDKELDEALNKKEKLESFLQQDSKEQLEFSDIYTKLNEIFQ